MKKIKEINRIIKDKEFATKVHIYFSSTAAGDDYDPYEDNKVYTNLNPLVIKAYVHEISPQTAFYKQYGLENSGMMEILCESRYRTWFEKCNKIVIDSIEYQVFREKTGNRTLITKRPYNMLRVVVTRKG